MKIAFEENDINMAIMMLNQIKVEGIQQASLMVAINNILIKGEKVEPADKAERTAEEES